MILRKLELNFLNKWINILDSYPEWDELPVSKLLFFNNKKDHMYPFVQARICYVKNCGFIFRIWSFEVNPKSCVTAKTVKIYNDSIVALNLCPFKDEDKFISVAVNPNGIVYSVLCHNTGETESIDGVINAFVFKDADLQGEYWGAEITLSDELIYKIFGKKLDVSSNDKIIGNVFAFRALKDRCDMASLFDIKKEDLFKLSKQCDFSVVSY